MNRLKYYILLLFATTLPPTGGVALVGHRTAFASTAASKCTHSFKCRRPLRLSTATYATDPTISANDELKYVDPRLVARAVTPSVALVMPVGVRNSTARGSGFVVDFPPKGIGGDGKAEEQMGAGGETHVLHLLTAAHVAAPGHRIDVSFPSNSSSIVEAKVLGRNVRADLALLRVALPTPTLSPTTPLPPPLQIGPSSAEVGTPSFAVGYPSGGVVGAAMTSGIVCATAVGLSTDNARNASGVGGVEDKEAVAASKVGPDKTLYVVTDAAMAGGMSGGPLVDADGTVLGVNALINMQLRALGNYAVDATECKAFLSEVAERLAFADDDESSTASESASDEYKLYLYNDPFNKRDRVAKILNGVANLEKDEAERIMMEAHTRGKSIIRAFSRDDRDEALSLSDALRREDILVEVEQTMSGQ